MLGRPPFRGPFVFPGLAPPAGECYGCLVSSAGCVRGTPSVSADGALMRRAGGLLIRMESTPRAGWLLAERQKSSQQLSVGAGAFFRRPRVRGGSYPQGWMSAPVLTYRFQAVSSPTIHPPTFLPSPSWYTTGRSSPQCFLSSAVRGGFCFRDGGLSGMATSGSWQQCQLRSPAPLQSRTRSRRSQARKIDGASVAHLFRDKRSHDTEEAASQPGKDQPFCCLLARRDTEAGSQKTRSCREPEGQPHEGPVH